MADRIVLRYNKVDSLKNAFTNSLHRYEIWGVLNTLLKVVILSKLSKDFFPYMGNLYKANSFRNMDCLAAFGAMQGVSYEELKQANEANSNLIVPSVGSIATFIKSLESFNLVHTLPLDNGNFEWKFIIGAIELKKMARLLMTYNALYPDFPHTLFIPNKIHSNKDISGQMITSVFDFLLKIDKEQIITISQIDNVKQYFRDVYIKYLEENGVLEVVKDNNETYLLITGKAKEAISVLTNLVRFSLDANVNIDSRLTQKLMAGILASEVRNILKSSRSLI